MKKQFFILFCSLFISLIVNAQTNSFPSSGNVGIGTLNPSMKLQITGSVSSGHNNTLTLDNNEWFNFGNVSGYGFINWFSQANVNRDNFINTHSSVKASSIRGSNGEIRFYTSAANNGIGQLSGLTERMSIESNGNIGIGITTPNSQLTVGSNFGANISGTTGGNAIFGSNIAVIQGGANHNKLITPTNHSSNYGYSGMRSSWGKLYFYTNSGNTNAGEVINPITRMYISQYGHVGIGTTDTKGFKLGVNGKIAATEVKVATYSNWADFVFNKDYKLPTLQEVEQHIKDNGHLKDIPDAKKVKKDGFYLAEMNAKLLQKIEELTLYTIEQNKTLEEQKIINKKLEEKLKLQEDRLKKIEALLLASKS